jgi:hypothetical protein
MNKSHFWTTLPFEHYLRKQYVLLAFSGSGNQKADEFFKTPFFEKKDGPSLMKSVVFWWLCIFVKKQKQNLTPNFT